MQFIINFQYRFVINVSYQSFREQPATVILLCQMRQRQPKTQPLRKQIPHPHPVLASTSDNKSLQSVTDAGSYNSDRRLAGHSSCTEQKLASSHYFSYV